MPTPVTIDFANAEEINFTFKGEFPHIDSPSHALIICKIIKFCKNGISYQYPFSNYSYAAGSSSSYLVPNSGAYYQHSSYVPLYTSSSSESQEQANLPPLVIPYDRYLTEHLVEGEPQYTFALQDYFRKIFSEEHPYKIIVNCELVLFPGEGGTGGEVDRTNFDTESSESSWHADIQGRWNAYDRNSFLIQCALDEYRFAGLVTNFHEDTQHKGSSKKSLYAVQFPRQTLFTFEQSFTGAAFETEDEVRSHTHYSVDIALAAERQYIGTPVKFTYDSERELFSNRSSTTAPYLSSAAAVTEDGSMATIFTRPVAAYWDKFTKFENSLTSAQYPDDTQIWQTVIDDTRLIQLPTALSSSSLSSTAVDARLFRGDRDYFKAPGCGGVHALHPFDRNNFIQYGDTSITWSIYQQKFSSSSATNIENHLFSNYGFPVGLLTAPVLDANSPYPVQFGLTSFFIGIPVGDAMQNNASYRGIHFGGRSIEISHGNLMVEIVAFSSTTTRPTAQYVIKPGGDLAQPAKIMLDNSLEFLSSAVSSEQASSDSSKMPPVAPVVNAGKVDHLPLWNQRYAANNSFISDIFNFEPGEEIASATQYGLPTGSSDGAVGFYTDARAYSSSSYTIQDEEETKYKAVGVPSHLGNANCLDLKCICHRYISLADFNGVIDRLAFDIPLAGENVKMLYISMRAHSVTGKITPNHAPALLFPCLDTYYLY